MGSIPYRLTNPSLRPGLVCMVHPSPQHFEKINTIIHKLQNFVPPFTLDLDVENAPNPTRIHFEKTSRKFNKNLLNSKTLFLA